MTQTPPPPVNYDFSGLPNAAARDGVPASQAAKVLAVLGMLVGGLIVATAGALVTSVASGEIEQSRAEIDPATLTGGAPQRLDLFTLELGRIMEIFGSVLAAVGVAVAVWVFVFGRRSDVPDGQ